MTDVAASAPKKVKKNAYRTKRARTEARRAYAICIPFYGYMAIWSVVPLVFGLYLAFVEYNGLGGSYNFVGFKNFYSFVSTDTYWILLFRQAWMGFLQVGLNMVLSFCLALMLNVSYKIRGFYRAAVYFPTLSAASATTAVFVALMSSTGGINTLVKALGHEPIVWIQSQGWAIAWIIFYGVWAGIGPQSILWLGGLQGIDPSLYEAAKVDGANRWQEIKYITIPGLRFITMYIMLTGIIGAMQMFGNIMFISGGNPQMLTDVLMYRIYRDGIVNWNVGMAGAESWILGIVVLILCAFYYLLVRKVD